MSYQEKRSLVSLFGSVGVTAIYFATMVQSYPQTSAYAPEVFRFWGQFFLTLIPLSIVAKVVIHVLFSILNTLATREDEPALSDERDHLIELKGARNALYVLSVGIMLAMATLVLDMPPAVMFGVLIGAGLVSSMVSDMSLFLLYRRGF